MALEKRKKKTFEKKRIEASRTPHCTTSARTGADKERKKTDNPREGWEDGTPPPHRDFKDRSVVLAVAHPIPWSSASFYLPSQSLADSRCNLHATSRSSHSRRSPSCRFLLCRVALVCLVLRRCRRLSIPCSRGLSRLSERLQDYNPLVFSLERNGECGALSLVGTLGLNLRSTGSISRTAVIFDGPRRDPGPSVHGRAPGERRISDDAPRPRQAI